MSSHRAAPARSAVPVAGRQHRRVVGALLILGLLAAALVQLVATAPPAQAMGTTILNPGGGQLADGSDGLEIHASSNLQYQVKYRGRASMYNPAVETASGTLYNGVFLAVGNTLVGSKETKENGHPATPYVDAVFTELSQTAISGAGTVLSPYVLSTSVFVDTDESGDYSPEADYLLTLDLSYITGRSSFGQTYTVVNPDDSSNPVKLYHIVDSYFQGSDRGPAYALDEAGAEITTFGADPSLVGVSRDGAVPGDDEFMAFLEAGEDEFAHYFSGKYDNTALYATGINDGGDIDDGLDFTETTDNGFGVQYDLSPEPGSHTVSNYFVYDRFELPPLAQLDVVKLTNGEPDGGDIPFADGITWSVLIENTGDQVIENVVAVDNIEGVMTCPTTTLLPGDQISCDVQGSSLLGGYENTVTVTGSSTSTDATVEEQSTSRYTGVGDVPAVTIEKFTNGNAGHVGDINEGEAILWTYVVTNNTNQPMVDVVVTDEPEGVASCTNDATTIPPGESLTCSIAGVAVAGEYTNMVQVTGAIEGIGEVSATDSGSYSGVGLACVAIPQQESLVGWWDFDAGYGEKSGAFADGVVTGGVVLDPAGMVGGAASFAGGRVDTSGDLDLGAGDVSVDMWVKVDPQRTIEHMVTYRTASTGFSLYLWNNGSGSQPGIVIDGIPYSAPVSHVIPDDGEFHLLTVTLSAAGDLSFYVDDGDPFEWATGVTGSRNSATQEIKFGQDFDNGSDSFTGQLDEVEIFNSVLTREDVASLFNAGPAGKCDVQLSIDKTTDGSQGRPFKRAGESVQWDYTVTNTGAYTVSNISVTDDMEGAVMCPSTVLAPGESMDCTPLTGTAVRGGYENTATVVGQLGTIAVSASDTSGYVSEIRLRDHYIGLAAERLLDTRNDTEGQYATPWGPGETRAVTVVGVGGVPADGVEAVMLNVTTVSPTAGFSWLTIDPAGAPSSGTATHTFGTASTTTEITNDLVVVKVGANGAIDITNAFGDVELVIDVVGYFTAEQGAGYEPLEPARLLDTRNDTQGDFATPWGAGETRAVKVTGVGGVPETSIEAVVLNVTSVSPTAGFSWLTVNPTGVEPSTTSAHNFGAALAATEIVNDVVIAKVGDGGFIDITNAFGEVDLVIDVVGYYSLEGGAGYLALTPERILDSRNATEGDYETPWSPGEVREISAEQFAGCSAVAVHVTTVNPTAGFSWLTATPTGETGGTAAHTFGTDAYTSEIVNDIVIAKLNSSGTFFLENARGDVDLVIDLVGLYHDEFTSDLRCLASDG